MSESSSSSTAATSKATGLDSRIAALLLTFVGFAIRIWGITWGLPNRDHLYSYHPDEILIIGASHAADVWSGHFNPHFYNYGSLIPFLNSLLRPLAYVALAPTLYTDYLMGRVITAIFGAATIYVTFLLARRIGGNAAGWIAAGLLAIAPAHALHSHYLTVDVPATFWVTLCLYLCVAAQQEGKDLWGILAGVAAGLAAGTKYNAGVVILAVVALYWGQPRKLGKPLGAFFLAFLLSTPGIVLWTGQFWRDFSYELQHTRTGHGLVFTGTAPGWIFHWWINLRWGLGLPLLILTTLATLSGLYRLWSERSARKDRGDGVHPYVFLLAFAVPYYLVISGAQVKFLRYIIPLIPLLLVFLACEMMHWLFYAVSGKVKSTSDLRAKDLEDQTTLQYILSTLIVIFGGGTTFYVLVYTLGFVGLLSQTPPQDTALAWIRQNAQGRTVGLIEVPWFYSPPVSPYNAGPQSRAEFTATENELPYKILITGTDADRLKAASPNYFILSDYETDALRLMKNPKTSQLPEVQQFARFWAYLNENYRETFTAQNKPKPAVSMLIQDEPPHDWRYPYPTIHIWRRIP